MPDSLTPRSRGGLTGFATGGLVAAVLTLAPGATDARQPWFVGDLDARCRRPAGDDCVEEYRKRSDRCRERYAYGSRLRDCLDDAREGRRRCRHPGYYEACLASQASLLGDLQVLMAGADPAIEDVGAIAEACVRRIRDNQPLDLRHVILCLRGQLGAARRGLTAYRAEDGSFDLECPAAARCENLRSPTYGYYLLRHCRLTALDVDGDGEACEDGR